MTGNSVDFVWRFSKFFERILTQGDSLYLQPEPSCRGLSRENASCCFGTPQSQEFDSLCFHRVVDERSSMLLKASSDRQAWSIESKKCENSL